MAVSIVWGQTGWVQILAPSLFPVSYKITLCLSPPTENEDNQSIDTAGLLRGSNESIYRDSTCQQ